MNRLALEWLVSFLAGATPLAVCAQAGVSASSAAGLEEEVVLSGTAIGGLRLDVTRFSDPRPAPELLAEIRRLWSQRPAPVQTVDQDGWFRLVQVHGDSIETIEVRPSPLGAGTTGRRSRLRKDDEGRRSADDWMQRVLPAGSRVLEQLAHEDGQRQLTTLVAVTAASAQAAAQALIPALAQVGFLESRQGRPSFEGQGRAMFLSRGPEDLAVTISEHAGHRAVVMHWGRARR